MGLTSDPWASILMSSDGRPTIVAAYYWCDPEPLVLDTDVLERGHIYMYIYIYPASTLF